MFIDKNGVVRMPKAYLAGFHIFYEDCDQRGEELKRLCRKYGIIGIYPPDPEPQDQFPPYQPKDGSLAEEEFYYFTRDVNHIRRSDMILAQLEDYHGCEPDSGTAFECGACAALGYRLYAYCDSTEPLVERIKCEKHRREDGVWVDGDGNSIEDFGYPLNLMFSGCMKVADSFENMLRMARADFDAELIAAGYPPFEVKD